MSGCCSPAHVFLHGKPMIRCPKQILEKYKCKSSALATIPSGRLVSCQLMNGRDTASVCVFFYERQKRRERRL